MSNSIFDPLGHVIRIIDEYSVIVDVGKDILSVDDYIQIYQLGDPIIDLQGNELCKYVFVKDKLRVIDVQDCYSVCRKEKTITKKGSATALFALSPLLDTTYQEKEKLQVNENDIQPLNHIDPTITIGDYIKLAWHFYHMMVRWILTEMVVVEMTRSKSLLPLVVEGGIFSIYG